MIWFTSDLHLGHARVLEFTDRPWGTLEAMHEALLGSINARVDADDELYVLGDFSFKATREEAMAFRSQINCEHVHLVPGNHDKDWSVPEFAGTFILEPPIKVIKDGPQKIVLSHYPMADWQSMRHGSWHLHGHIHSADTAYNEANRMQGLLRYDVGADANGYCPVSLDQVKEWFAGVEPSGRTTWQLWVNQTGDEGVAELLRSAGAEPEL